MLLSPKPPRALRPEHDPDALARARVHVKRIATPFHRFWSTDRGLSAFLALLALLIFVVLPLRRLDAAGVLLSLGLMASVVMARVVRAGPITASRIAGAVAVYLVMGLMAAELYRILEVLQPGSFAGIHRADGVDHDLLYFSFVTLTTVGYGDITPVAPLARSVAIAEALVGQLFLVIMISRLVSLEIESHRAHR